MIQKKNKITSVICIFCILAGFVAVPVDTVAASKQVQVNTEEEMVDTIYKALLLHKTQVCVIYQDEIKDILHVEKKSQVTVQSLSNYIDDTLKKAYKKDEETSDDYDYIRWSVYGYKWTVKYEADSMYPQFEIQFSYHENSTQLKKVNKASDKIVQSLNLQDASAYKKVKAVHDYLVAHTQYNRSGTGHSAYSALIKKKAVCQGYSLALYKLLTEVGVPCRIVTGTSHGENHAWNIVCINGTWYNVDVTWDDPFGGTKASYDYFLKGTNDFYKDHKLDAEYKKDGFKKAYPIAKGNYKNKKY